VISASSTPAIKIKSFTCESWTSWCHKGLWPLVFVVVLTFNSLSVSTQSSSTQVGASGDLDSIGSMGVRAEIRTHIYHVNQPDADYFWVGNYLDNGGLIEFGYVIYAPATLCPYEVEGSNTTCTGNKLKVNGSEPLWYWAYMVRTDHYYYDMGRYSSIEFNGTWHLYSIEPDSGDWKFYIDGNVVSTANFVPTRSRFEVALVAEKSSYSSTPGPLGPVEFRNLTYLKQDGWHEANSLTAIVNCGGESCVSVAYGVALDGPNHIIAGTSVPKSQDGNTLWGNTQSLPQIENISMPVLYGLLLAAIMGTFIFLVIRKSRRKKTS